MQIPSVTMSAANAYTEIQVPLPVNRFPEKSGKVNIIEVLKVWFDLPESDNNNAAGGNLITSNGQISTQSQTGFAKTSAKVIAYQEKIYRGAFTAAGTYQNVITEPTAIDLTDGAGHGVLVATDNLFFALFTQQFIAAGTGSAKILYRFKRVALQEYIGIVQSQQ